MVEQYTQRKESRFWMYASFYRENEIPVHCKLKHLFIKWKVSASFEIPQLYVYYFFIFEVNQIFTFSLEDSIFLFKKLYIKKLRNIFFSILFLNYLSAHTSKNSVTPPRIVLIANHWIVCWHSRVFHSAAKKATSYDNNAYYEKRSFQRRDCFCLNVDKLFFYLN